MASAPGKSSPTSPVSTCGGRDSLELQAMRRLEDALRAQFSPKLLPAHTSVRSIVLALWEQAISKEARGVLMLVMDLSRRAWSGSTAARPFYEEQLRLWSHLLLRATPDKKLVEEVIVMFQGALLTFLVTGDFKTGRRSLLAVLSQGGSRRKTANDC